MNRDVFNSAILHGVFAGVALYVATSVTAEASVTNSALRLAKPTSSIAGEAQASADALRYANSLASLYGDAYLTDTPLRFAHPQTAVVSLADSTASATLTAYPTSSLYGEATVTATGVQIISALAADSFGEAQLTALGERLPYAYPRTIFGRAELTTDMARINTFRVNFVRAKSYFNGIASVRNYANDKMGFSTLAVEGEFTAGAFVRRAGLATGTVGDVDITADATRYAAGLSAITADADVLAFASYTHAGVTYRSAYAVQEATAELVTAPVRYAISNVQLVDTAVELSADAFNRKAAKSVMYVTADFMPYLVPARAAFCDMYAELSASTSAIRFAKAGTDIAGEGLVVTDPVRLVDAGSLLSGEAEVTALGLRSRNASTLVDGYGLLQSAGGRVTAYKVARPTTDMYATATVDAVWVRWVKAGSQSVVTLGEAVFNGVRKAEVASDLFGEAQATSSAYAVRPFSTDMKAEVVLTSRAKRTQFATATMVAELYWETYLRASSKSAPTTRTITVFAVDRLLSVDAQDRTLEV